jgi:hypothetical protein
MFGRSLWQIKPIRTCPLHNIPLTELSSKFGSHIIHDFAYLIEPFVPQLDQLGFGAERRPFSDFERYLTNRLQQNVRQGLWLDDLGFSAAGRLCEMLGAVAEFGPMPNLRLLTSDDWARAGQVGFQIVRDGQSALTEFLKTLQQRPHADGKTGPQAFYGRFYQWLAFGSDDPDLTPIRGIVREHIIDTMAVGPGDIVLGKPVFARRIHSVASAAKEYGLHVVTLRKTLFAAGLVPPVDAPVHHALACFDAASAAPLLKSLAEGIELHRVREYLNMPRAQASLLVNAGIIAPVVKAIDCKPLFDKGHLDALIARISRDAIDVRNVSAPYFNIPMAARRACCSAVKIVSMLIAGELEWVGRDRAERGYLSILINSDEVRAKMALPRPEGIGVGGISQDFGIPYNLAKQLIVEGVLPAFSAINPINRCPQKLVPIKAYENFKAEYVSLRDLSRTHGIGSRLLLKILTDRGILPLEKFRLDHSFVYRRKELD